MGKNIAWSMVPNHKFTVGDYDYLLCYRGGSVKIADLSRRQAGTRKTFEYLLPFGFFDGVDIETVEKMALEYLKKYID